MSIITVDFSECAGMQECRRYKSLLARHRGAVYRVVCGHGKTPEKPFP